MPLLGNQHRNHSFPPSFRFIHKTSTKNLAPPQPDIDDEPWVHFLTTVIDDDDYEDYLDFSAGILSSSEISRKKPSKFRPSNAKKWGHKVVNYHHGNFQRHEEQHGFVENRQDPWSHIVEHDIKNSSEPMEHTHQLRPRGRSKTRTLSGHRHSWREPSVDLFTVEEEVDDYAEKGEGKSAGKAQGITRNNDYGILERSLQDNSSRSKL